MEKIKFYVFGESGKYDEYNPYYVLDKKYISEIIYIISINKPFSINRNTIINRLNINDNDFDSAIYSLSLINAIYVNNDTYKLNFPVFLEKDIDILDTKLNEVGISICNRIKELKVSIVNKLYINKNFSYERILYHIICDSIFDGIAMDFFAKKDLLSISKNQPGCRDYIIVGYENTDRLEKHSNNLLCSSNNYITKEFIFNSFGDCNGNRKDIYRFFRQLEQKIENTSNFEKLNTVYATLNDYNNKSIMNDCGNLIIRSLDDNNYNNYAQDEKELLNFLIEMNYISVDLNGKIKIEVPIFDKSHKKIVEDIADIILTNIESIVKDFFRSIEDNLVDITPILHRVDVKEIANELWHQVFGIANEYLVKDNLVEKPYSKNGEGRYLRSLYIK